MRNGRSSPLRFETALVARPGQGQSIRPKISKSRFFETVSCLGQSFLQLVSPAGFSLIMSWTMHCTLAISLAGRVAGLSFKARLKVPRERSETRFGARLGRKRPERV